MVERQDTETPELDDPSAARGVQASGLILAPWERVFDRILTPFEPPDHRRQGVDGRDAGLRSCATQRPHVQVQYRERVD